MNPEFTRYELEFFTDNTSVPLVPSEREPYSFTNSNIQLHLPADTYYIVANGYNGDVLAAKSEVKDVTVSDGALTPAPFVLKPYMKSDINGTLNFSLSWDGLARMPARAELLIEYYGDHDSNSATEETWEPIAPSYIPQALKQAGPGTLLLLNKADAFINLSGSLSLPPGEYALTMTLTMDEGGSPVPRYDIAHVYSNLTTPAAFYYGGGDLLIFNSSPDSGAAFITGFTFKETPNATTVIGSEPGADGTRLIMIMVPAGTELKANPSAPSGTTGLTPTVDCAPGSFITSPLPADRNNPDSYGKGEIDFSKPTIWTAQARNGAVQRYTVVVSSVPVAEDNKKITYFFFEGYADHPGIIDQGTSPGDPGTITVQLPYAVSDPRVSLTPVISIIGYEVLKSDNTAVGPDDFSSSKAFNVYATSGNADTPKIYTVTVEVSADTEKEITKFSIDGYPGVSAVITPDAGGGQGTITATLPYGVSLKNLSPLIQYRGAKLDPPSGAAQNFSAPVYYTVTAGDDSQKTYRVTLSNAPANTDTGIFDFRIINVPAAKVVIGQKPRQDGRIPIVIQVPYGTNEKNLITAITLRSTTSTISPASGTAVPFGNASNNQEAVYTVASQGYAKTQQYVVVVSAGGQYYYVNGVAGDDTDPDYYTGEAPERAFKTLAYAVKKASEAPSTIDHIFVSGELNAGNQTGNNTDPSAITEPGSVIAINGTGGKKITVTGTSNATFRGASGKRVLFVTGGASLVFENITVTGGDAATTSHSGNGGGIYTDGNSKVKFSGGSITGNKAAGSGGGVYVEGSGSSGSEFTLMDASITNNTALGTSTILATLAGGGGVCVSGDAVFWFGSGTIANNTAGERPSATVYRGGSGGGVLVRGTLVDIDYDGTPANYGFIMSGGTISGNNSYGSASPHGGGGVYVATGEFDMLGGSITSNYSKRQGGGVFVHSGAVFNVSGTSSITGNEGVGSSKGICSRGVTELTGSAQADTIYVWNPLAADAAPLSGAGADYNKFTLAQNAKAGGIVLAHSTEYRNNIVLAGITGTGKISNIDLEGHLTNGMFVDTDINDWLNKTVLKGTASNTMGRFSLGTFVGQGHLILSSYHLVLDSTEGKLRKK
jgi:hypothetical protein